jgi:mono/diheme cytochrome c family protein
MCHGDAGQGEGPDGQNFVPEPANFTVDEFDDMPDSELFWKLTVGIGNTAMPQWGVLISEEDRWNAIKYLKGTFISPSEPKEVSDELPVAYQALESPFADTADARDQGKANYDLYCSGCHGATGMGDGPYGAPLMPTPANLTEDPAVNSPAEWWYWRLDEGVVGFDGKLPHPTAMPAWRFILTDQQKWNIIYYAMPMVGVKPAPGGAP